VARRAQPLFAQPLVDLAPVLAGYDDPAFGADEAGAIYIVAGRHAETLVLRWQPGDLVPTPLARLADEPLVFRFVQPLPDGLVLVAPRCRVGREGAEANALVLDAAGRARARFSLGDGIADVRATPDGTIWVAYFDEGIFGRRGASGPGKGPIGAAGLRAFTATGEPRFAYRADAAGTEPIRDCYALNVSSDSDAWIYFYDEFPIVRINNGRYHLWHTNVSGATALAVRGKRALLLGDYERGDVVHVLELGAKGSATIAARRLLVDATGKPLAPTRARGVGASLYCLHRRAISLISDW
jgi:hypothetical protein